MRPILLDVVLSNDADSAKEFANERDVLDSDPHKLADTDVIQML